MADRTGWIRMRSRLHEDAAVLQAADSLHTEIESLSMSACITMIEGAVLRLWGYGANYGKRVGETNDCLVNLTPSMIDHLCGLCGVCMSLDAAGLSERDKDGTVMPGLLKWVDLVDEAREKERVRKQEYRDRLKDVPRDNGGTTKDVPSVSHVCPRHRDRDRDRDRDKSKDKRRATKPEPKQDERFDLWWDSYPIRRPGARKGHKTTAASRWAALKPAEIDRVIRATAMLIKSGDLPCDAERFLAAPRGVGEPRYAGYLDNGNSPVAGGQSRAAQTQNQRESGKPAYDTSFLTKGER